MRSFHVAFYNELEDIVAATIRLEPGEKANEDTFMMKINEKYINNGLTHFCIQVVSWSLIEE